MSNVRPNSRANPPIPNFPGPSPTQNFDRFPYIYLTVKQKLNQPQTFLQVVCVQFAFLFVTLKHFKGRELPLT